MEVAFVCLRPIEDSSDLDDGCLHPLMVFTVVHTRPRCGWAAAHRGGLSGARLVCLVGCGRPRWGTVGNGNLVWIKHHTKRCR
jgi:hypothetical protein